MKHSPFERPIESIVTPADRRKNINVLASNRLAWDTLNADRMASGFFNLLLKEFGDDLFREFDQPDMPAEEHRSRKALMVDELNMLFWEKYAGRGRGSVSRVFNNILAFVRHEIENERTIWPAVKKIEGRIKR